MSKLFFQNKLVYLYQQIGNSPEADFFVACIWFPDSDQDNVPRMSSRQFVSCGMYAPNTKLQQAWQRLFDAFIPLSDQYASLAPDLVFDGSENILRHQDMLFGHTCGYPLMTNLQDQLIPFCMPVFNVKGCEGNRYSSQFVVAKDSNIQNLSECRGKRLAINHHDSNSGMNVLRYELSRIGAKPGYFGETFISGGHWQSLEAVASNRADLAAIDSVSLQLAYDANPVLEEQIRIIGQSEKTGGLPFVTGRSGHNPQFCRQLIDHLNEALSIAPDEVKADLHLSHFEQVDLDHYSSILQFKNEAEENGYPALN